MGTSAQKKAVDAYRARQAGRGVARFEIQALETDRSLLRDLARKLAVESSEAMELRAKVVHAISGEPPKKGGILAALRRSPMVGADLDLTRSTETGRRVDL
jgi:hypothetical protein